MAVALINSASATTAANTTATSLTITTTAATAGSTLIIIGSVGNHSTYSAATPAGYTKILEQRIGPGPSNFGDLFVLTKVNASGGETSPVLNLVSGSTCSATYFEMTGGVIFSQSSTSPGTAAVGVSSPSATPLTAADIAMTIFAMSDQAGPLTATATGGWTDLQSTSTTAVADAGIDVEYKVTGSTSAISNSITWNHAYSSASAILILTANMPSSKNQTLGFSTFAARGNKFFGRF